MSRDDDENDFDNDNDIDTDDDSELAERRSRNSYCGQTTTIMLDPGGGTVQSYVEDCEVCCRPWQLTVTFDEEGRAEVIVEREEE